MQTPTDCQAATGGGEQVRWRGKPAGPGQWVAHGNSQTQPLEMHQSRGWQAAGGWSPASAAYELGPSLALREMGML